MFRFLGITIIFLLPATLNGIAKWAFADDQPAANSLPGRGAAEQNLRSEGLSGEVTVIESKGGSSVAVEHAQIRMVAGQSFVGGNVFLKDPRPDTAQVAGSRIWIAGSEIIRIVEFDTKAQFAGKNTASDLSNEIAKIEALGGRVQRDNSQPGRPIITIVLTQSEKLKDEDLQFLSSCPSLQRLQLSGTDTSDAGLKHLARLKNLTYLGLIGTKITDAGLKELVGLQNLAELRVGNTAITDAGLKDLAKLKNLKMVGLIGTQVTDAGVKEFSEALPNMQHNLGPDGTGATGQNGAASQGGGQRPDPNFDVSVAHPAYTDKHPSVFFDEAHRNFHTASGRYKVFADLATNDGYRVVPNKEALTPQRLAGHDILIIANAMADRGTAKSAFTEAECDCVQNWVKAGGSLLLITDHEPFGSASEDLGKRFGVEMSLLVAGDPANQTNEGLLFSREKNQLGDHPIMTGRGESEQVNRVLTFTGQSLTGPAGSTALLKFADTAKHQGNGIGASAAGRSQGLALNYGQGRVVVMGEAAQLSAQVYGNPPEAMGMNVPGCDNRQMALNLMHWLSGLTD